eukprot:TRINITY_DN8446_c0_g1_i2.p1 TRINITY_DN8446_c0_g1~~TRINITY_DN8446_c0_g1_i2.p1  ORF type:complete len:231 (+),score=22.04 TRINITY_DN8446_c0_g1_i2:1-693(+)
MKAMQTCNDHLTSMEEAAEHNEEPPAFDWAQFGDNVVTDAIRSLKYSFREFTVQGIRISMMRYIHESCNPRKAWKLLKSQYHSALRKLSRGGLRNLIGIFSTILRGQLLYEAADMTYRLAAVPVVAAYRYYYYKELIDSERMARQALAEVLMVLRLPVNVLCWTGAVCTYYYFGGLVGIDTDAIGFQKNSSGLEISLMRTWLLLSNATILLETGISYFFRTAIEEYLDLR